MLFDHRVWLERQPPHKQQFSEYPKQIYRLLCFACYRNIFLHLIHFVRMQFIDLARVWSLARSNMQNVNLDVVFDLFVWNCGNRQDR